MNQQWNKLDAQTRKYLSCGYGDLHPNTRIMEDINPL